MNSLRLPHPVLVTAVIVAAHGLALVPLATCSSVSIGGLVFVVAVAIAARRYFEPGFGRAVAGVALSMFAGFVWVFAKGSGAPAVLALPVVVFAALYASTLLLARFAKEPESLRAAPVITAVIVILGTLGMQRTIEPALGVPPLTDDFFFSLRQTAAPAPLTEAERAQAMALVDSVLRRTPTPTLTGRLAGPRGGRVFVTLFRPAKRANWTRGMSVKETLGEAIVEAAGSALDDAPRRATWSRHLDDIRVVIDLAGEEQQLGGQWLREFAVRFYEPFAPKKVRWRFLVYDGEPGVDGFRIEQGSHEGIVLPGDNTYFGWTTPRSRKRRFRAHNLDPALRELAKRAGIDKSDPWPDGAQLYNFRSYSFARPNPASQRTVELYRANVLIPDLPNEAALLDAIDRAGKWLLGTVEPDGRFDYEYFPNRDAHGKGYNEVRHAGSVYGLFHLTHVARGEPTLASTSDGYLRAGLTAMDRVYRSLGPAPGSDPSEGLVAFLEGEDGVKTNSGAAALTLLSFLERPTAQDTDDADLAASIRREGDDEIMAGLVKTLLRMIDDRGWVYGNWTDARDGVVMEREPLYYPGEAMLALARYHDQVGDEAALNGAKAIGRRQVALLDRFWTVPDHWVMQGMDVLDRLEPDEPMWREGGYEMARRFMADQSGTAGSGLRHRAPHPDYRGAYRRITEVPRTTRAASRGEAVGGVARIAWRHGDDAEAMEGCLLEGARHLMEQMYTPDNSFFFPDPSEALGAVRMGIIDNHIRIDNNQHAVVALANALDAVRRSPGTVE